jgi:hypothetical protein
MAIFLRSANAIYLYFPNIYLILITIYLMVSKVLFEITSIRKINRG